LSKSRGTAADWRMQITVRDENKRAASTGIESFRQE
jgi:hypothetical protein